MKAIRYNLLKYALKCFTICFSKHYNSSFCTQVLKFRDVQVLHILTIECCTIISNGNNLTQLLGRCKTRNYQVQLTEHLVFFFRGATFSRANSHGPSISRANSLGLSKTKSSSSTLPVEGQPL